MLLRAASSLLVAAKGAPRGAPVDRLWVELALDDQPDETRLRILLAAETAYRGVDQ